jgi:hypothetical protein
VFQVQTGLAEYGQQRVVRWPKDGRAAIRTSAAPEIVV